MAQIIEVKCLTEEQAMTTVENMCKVRGLAKPKVLSTDKPSFSKDIIQKYNLSVITKFGDRYITLLATRNGKDDKATNEVFVIVFAEEMDKYYFTAIVSLYHTTFKQYIDPSSKHPHVTILAAFVVTEAMKVHYRNDILPCNYRIFSLCELYPMIGSKNKMFKLSYDYELHEYEPTYNKKEYTAVYDFDPVAKMLNAIEGDIIVCKRLILDNNIYSDVQIREVKALNNAINMILPSGLCYNYKGE
jgi:hypothetical protein